jgi:tripartite-type tricarboxylate transporter receptor subunit TctC
VVDTLNKAVNEIIGEKAVESRMIEEGADPVAGTPERFGAFVKSEFEKWRVVVQQSGAKVD